ncbi:MAG: SAM-dependent chlorinase/fluorinase [Elainellaceae cyanobacterium]
MTINPLLTLLSDFGWNDVYVGVMKGVIAQINSHLNVVDLTHDIPPQNITAAQFNLLNAYPYFPKGTIHVAVVDPGVGGSRRAIAIELADGFLVGPDNGIFTSLIAQKQIVQVVELTNTRYWRIPEPSNTFHGRDIFAPVAAHLASGVTITDLGNSLDPASLVQFSLAACLLTSTGFMGRIQHIDRFGNVITNIPGDYVQGKEWVVLLGKRSLPGCRTYGDVPQGSPLALVGSHGWVEIAVNGGDAHFQLRLNWEDEVQLVWRQ